MDCFPGRPFTVCSRVFFPSASTWSNCRIYYPNPSQAGTKMLYPISTDTSKRRINMKKKRSILIIAAILALALVCSPVAAIGTGGMLSQLASHSRMNSFFSGYSPGTGVTPETPALPVPDPTSGTQYSASERIASLLNSDVGNWQPPAGRVYDLPVHTPTEREEYTALPIPIFVRTCSSCGQSSPFFSS